MTPALILAGAVVVLLLAIVASQRFHAAEETIRAIRDQGGIAPADRWHLALAWAVATILGATVAWAIAQMLIERAGTDDDRSRACFLARGAIGAWVVWSGVGIVSVIVEPPAFVSALGSALEPVVVLLFLATLLIAGREPLGGFRAGWDRASPVRLQMLLLALLYVVLFVVGLTGDQCAEVLRAWGDNWSRAAAGVAAALLLGVAVRASSSRLLSIPRTSAPVPRARRENGKQRTIMFIAAAAAAAAAVGLACVHAWTGVIALILAALAVGLSTSSPKPTVGAGNVADSPWNEPLDEVGRARLADSLGLFPILVLTAGLMVATVDSWLLPGAKAPLQLTSLTALVAVVFGILVAGAHTRPSRPRAARAREPSRARLPGGLRDGRRLGAFVVLLSTALGFAAGIGRDWVGGALGAAPIYVVAALAVLLALRLLGEDSLLAMGAVGGIVAGVLLSVYSHPVGAPRALGAFAIVLLGAAGAVLALHGLASWTQRRLVRKPAWLPWPTHVPLVTLFAIWLGVAFFLVPPTQHQARTVSRGFADGFRRRPASIQDAVSAWMDTQTVRRGAMPMLLVGASGGGSKAAYWTGLVLDCVLGGTPPAGERTECGPGKDQAATAGRRLERMFATSSVSGGSVGVYHFVTHVDDAVQGTDWVDASLGPEVLSPATAWGVFHDAPSFLLGLRTNPNDCHGRLSCWLNADRALVQERAVAGSGNDLSTLPATGILERPERTPVTVFNGSLDNGAGRFLVSPLDLSPQFTKSDLCRAAASDAPVTGALDAHDVLAPDRDLSLVTASLLSARFPLLSPAARVGDNDAKDVRGCNLAGALTAVRVRDGGYVENTGLLTLTDMLPAIRRAIRRWRQDNRRPYVQVPIIVLSIDDDPEVAPAQPADSPNPKEDEAKHGSPLAIASKEGPSYLSRMARDSLSSCHTGNVTYVRVSPSLHPGAHAATGWEISRTGRRRDLASSLSGDAPAMRRLRLIRHMLDGAAPARVCP